MNLYSILEIEHDASHEEIKNAYKLLARKFHPDKNGNKEKFQSLSMAYQILSDPEQRERYDNMNPNKKNTIFDIIINIYNKNFKENIYNFIIKDNEYNTILQSNDTTLIKKYIYQKLNNYISNILLDDNEEKDDEDIASIFISNKINPEVYNILDKNMSLETSINSTTNKDNLIELEIITDLNEIYMDKVKEIIFNRQRLKNKQIIIDNKKMLIPLSDDKIVLEKEGDDYIDDNGLLQRGDVIIKIKCRKNKYLERVNDYDILLNLPITLYEIFKGFNKKFKYLGDEYINLKSSNPINDFKFNGNKIIIIYQNKGLPYFEDKEKKRGKLFIYLILNKDELFYKKLYKYFN